MSASLVIAIWGVTAIVSMVAAAVLAATKRLDSSAWAMWGFLFPPSLIILALTAKNTGERTQKPSLDADDYYRD